MKIILQLHREHDLLPEAGAQIVVQEIREGVVYENNGVKVTAFEVDHRPVEPCYGYRMDYEETGELFTRVRPGLAVYTHMVLFKVGKDEIMERTRKTYGGPLVIGEDLMAFEIGETVKALEPPDDVSPKRRHEIVPDV